MRAIEPERKVVVGRHKASMKSFAEATVRYRPSTIRVLFIAEAPPAFRYNRLFYFEDLREGDTLFLEMMKTLYGQSLGFTEKGFTGAGSVYEIRRRKTELLALFKHEGYFLIDASEKPMPDLASSFRKLALLRASFPRLVARLKRFEIDSGTPIVLIGAVTFAACAKPLRELGFNVVNVAMIDHPARGGQARFRQKLRQTLQKVALDFSADSNPAAGGRIVR